MPTMDGPQRRVFGHRRADGVVGGGDGDADHALTATFRYFVGFHSRAIRCTPFGDLEGGCHLEKNVAATHDARFWTAIWRRSVLVADDEAKLNHMWASV